MGVKTTTPEICQALRVRYAPPEFGLFFEVANGTGSNIKRYTDAFAMNLFPSRGLTFHGFEVKVSRNDWQKELQNPAKCQGSLFPYCDHWWIVAPVGIVAAAELPPTWGLLEYREKGLRSVVAAPKLNPLPLDRETLAPLLRRASEDNDGIINREVNKIVNQRLDGIEEQVRLKVEAETRAIRHKLENVAAIEKQLGISLTNYHAHPGYGRILRAIDRIGLAQSHAGIRGIASSLRSMLKEIDSCVAEFDAVVPEVK